MTQTIVRFASFGGLALALFGCSSTDSSTNDPRSSGGSTQQAGTGGGANQAGAPNGGSPAVGGSAGNSSAGSSNGGSSAAGSSGNGGAAGSASGGAAGVGGGGGSGGSVNPTCTPGTGTQDVGTKSQLDQKTCLTWTKARSATTLNNRQAAKYCADLDQDGISDWRVPHPDELATWPGLTTDSTAYITGPTYIPTASTSDQQGCTGDSHSCNIAKYNDTSLTCGWQGVGFTGWVTCVHGTPNPGSTNGMYAAANCSPCNGELASFKETDCSAYAN